MLHAIESGDGKPVSRTAPPPSSRTSPAGDRGFSLKIGLASLDSWLTHLSKSAIYV